MIALRLASTLVALAALLVMAPGCAGLAQRTGAPGELSDLEAGREALALGELDTARRAFAAALVLRPDDFDARHGMALVELEELRYADSLASLDALAAAAPERFARSAQADYCDALLGAASAWLASGDLAAAGRWLGASPAQGCGGDQARGMRWQLAMARAERAYAAGDNALALVLFERADALLPASPAAARGVARVLLSAGRREEAIEHLDRALLRHRGDRELAALMVEALTTHSGEKSGE